MTGWFPQVGIKAIPVAPASPWENGFIESFHSCLRDEFLEREAFESVSDARSKATWWRREYNRVRPHGSLSYKTPEEFSAECDWGIDKNAYKKLTLSSSGGTNISRGPENG